MTPLIGTAIASSPLIVGIPICVLLGSVCTSHICRKSVLSFRFADTGEGHSGAAVATLLVCNLPVFLFFNQAGLCSSSKSASASLNSNKNLGASKEPKASFNLTMHVWAPVAI